MLCARMGLQQALSRLALGRRTDVPAEPPQCPEPNIHSWRAVCGTSPEYSFPASAHTLSKPSARVSFPAAQPHPLLHLPGEGERVSRGEAGMFRRDIRVSDAERGRVPCRSKEHTASTRPTEPNHHIQPKIKSLLPWGRRLVERLTGIEPAYQAWEACALPLSYSRIFFSVSRLLVGREICCGCLCAGRRG